MSMPRALTGSFWIAGFKSSEYLFTHCRCVFAATGMSYIATLRRYFIGCQLISGMSQMLSFVPAAPANMAKLVRSKRSLRMMQCVLILGTLMSAGVAAAGKDKHKDDSSKGADSAKSSGGFTLEQLTMAISGMQRQIDDLNNNFATVLGALQNTTQFMNAWSKTISDAIVASHAAVEANKLAISNALGGPSTVIRSGHGSAFADSAAAPEAVPAMGGLPGASAAVLLSPQRTLFGYTFTSPPAVFVAGRHADGAAWGGVTAAAYNISIDGFLLGVHGAETAARAAASGYEYDWVAIGLSGERQGEQ